MKKSKFLVLTISISFLFLLISCNNNKNPKITYTNEPAVKNLDSINILFYNYQPVLNKKIAPSDIKLDIPDFLNNSKGILNASITDSSQINNIERLITKLIPSTQKEEEDARVVLNFKHNDGSTLQLTLNGEYANQIFLNGLKQKDNNELVFTIKNYIGYYPWFIGDALAMMPELRDNSFAKEPFYRGNYYKKYQEVLSAK